MPIDASVSPLGGSPPASPRAVGGAEWQIAPIDGPSAITEPGAGSATGTSGGGASAFGGLLGDAISSLSATQQDAAAGAQQLAAGTAQDPTAVVMAVERAQLAMQLASQVRNKVVEAATDLFHTQV
jgi:flagellar hook-basal body complex protein FliE